MNESVFFYGILEGLTESRKAVKITKASASLKGKPLFGDMQTVYWPTSQLKAVPVEGHKQWFIFETPEWLYNQKLEEEKDFSGFTADKFDQLSKMFVKDNNNEVFEKIEDRLNEGLE